MADDIASLMFAASQKLTDQQFPDLKQMATLAALNQRTELERQKAAELTQNRNTLSQVFRNPTSLDERGLPTIESLRTLAAGAPAAYADILPMVAKGQHNQALEAAQNSKLAGSFKDAKYQLYKSALAQYDADLKDKGPEIAGQTLQGALVSGLNDMGTTGQYPRAWIDAMRGAPPPDPETLRREVLGEDAARAKPMTAYQQQIQGPIAVETAARERRGEEIKGVGEPVTREVTLPDGTKTIENLIYDKKSRGYSYAEGGAVLPEGAKIKEVPKPSGSTDALLLEKFRAEKNEAGTPATAAEEAAFMRSLRAPRSASAITLQKAMEENPNWTAADIASFNAWNRSRGAAEQAFATGVEGRATRSIDVAIDHLTALDELITAINNPTDSHTLSRLSNWAKTEFNLSTAPTSMEAARSIIGSEIVKAVQGGATALADREEARAPLDPSLSAEQLRDVIKVNKRLMAGQLRGLEQQYMSSVVAPDKRGDSKEEEKARKAYRYKLFPDTLTELESAHTPGAPASSKGTASPAASGPAPVKLRAGHEDDDWKALKPGTRFVGPDGEIGIKK